MEEERRPNRVPSILIGEDDLLFAKELSSSLARMGYRVLGQVTSGEKALELAIEHHPDLILMGIKLAGDIDGIAATQQILDVIDVPVVYITGPDEADVVEKAKQTEPYGYLCKPVNFVELKSTIETALYKHEADRRLKESELWMSGLFNALEESVIIVTLDRIVKDTNRATERIFGYRKEEIIGKTTEIVHVDQAHYAEFGRRVSKAFDTGQSAEFEFELKRKNGEIFPSHHTVALLRDRSGDPLGITSIVRDLSDRKKTELMLRESEERFRGIFENAAVGIFMRDLNGQLITANSTCEKILGYSREELKDLTFVDITHPDDRRKSIDHYQPLLEGLKSSYRIEKRFVCKDGSILWGDLSVSAILDSRGNRKATMGALIDITSRKMAEEQLRASLKEKEVLLREIHHRVKNNLAIVSGLLRLQSRDSKDELHKKMFIEAQDRIMSMAIAHEKLCNSNNLAFVDMKEYMNELLRHLYFTSCPGHVTVSVTKDIEPVELELDQAITIGLILNELVSNAFKHAYAGLERGELLITIRRLDGNGCELAVKDNGVGMSESIDIHNPGTLGLRLVRLLTRQLDGSMALHSEQGTEITITFENLKRNLPNAFQA